MFQPNKRPAVNTLRQLAVRIARHAPIPALAFLTRFVVCIAAPPPPPPPPRKFEIIFALRRIGILAGFGACILTLAILAAPDAQAQTDDACTFADITAEFFPENRAQISLQIDNCNAKGWGAKKNPNFDLYGHLSPSFRTCYCDIKAKDVSRNAACGMADTFCLFGVNTKGNTQCVFYFGATLQYLPERTEANKDSCFVANCPGGQEPSGFNMNGETECACPAGEIFHDGACAAPSVEVCGDEFSPAKFYDSAAGECVAFAVCQAEATLNRVANVCECAGAAVLDSAGTGCLCESPNVGTPGDCAAPSAEVCGGLTPAKFYDSAAGECVDLAVCTSPEVRNAGTNRCECSSPNVETDGGNCLVPSAQVCEDEFSPAKFYDAGAGACVDVAACLAPAVLDEAANLCNCPSPNVGTDGEVEPGKCAVPVPSAEACGDLIPAQFYSATLSACVPFVECAAPAVRNAGTNLCDCPAPYSGRDGAAAPGDCAAPPDACTIDDLNHAIYDAAGLMQLSLRIDTCNAKGWGAKKISYYSSTFRGCYCDIETIDSANHRSCATVSPEESCIINSSSVGGNSSCSYYFGATLQYLPQRTEENKDSCFVSHCPGGQQPSGFNMNGETECACPAGEFFMTALASRPARKVAGD